MKKIFTFILALLTLLLAGCISQPTPPAETEPAPNRVEFSNLEEYNANIPDSPNNFVAYENIRSLGKFEGFMSATCGEGNYEYGYILKDSNNYYFELLFWHIDKELTASEQIELPSGTKSMAQIEVDSKVDTRFHIESNGLIYRYRRDGTLGSIIGQSGGIHFFLRSLPKGPDWALEYYFLDYPLDGERTLLSLLLSTSSRDQQAAMRMMRRCLPKTWVQYTLYCAVPVVILAVVAVLIYRKKRKALSPTSTAPDAPDTPQSTEE